MALPSAKRRRLILSDDDEPVVKIRTPQPRLSSRPKTTLANGKSASHSQNPKKSKAKSATQASPKSSPEKPGKQIVKDKENKSLHTFFGRATEEQRWARRHESPTTIIEDGEAGDAIEDDSLDEALVELANCETDENEVLDRRKTSQPVPRTSFPAGLKNGPGSSQKFAKPPKQATKGLIPLAGQDTDNSNRPWADRFAPNSLDELAVHKKKLGDVQNWLSAVLFGRDRRRLLVLKGPAGSGKTTTVTLLSKALNFHISDWRNPTVTETGVASFSSQFDDFLSRGGAFGTLDFSKAFGQPESAHNPTHADAQKRVLLVEEFPSTMALSSSALASFRRILLQYLAAAVLPRSALLEQSNSHLASHPPIVLVISESLLTSATSSTDSFTAHRLLGPELCNHPYATVLEFNPVAPTLIVKALELAIKKEARISKRRRIPGPAVIKRLADLGDVRSAINGLEFLCVRAEADSDWGGRTAAKVKRSGKSNSSLTNMEKQSLELVTQREAQLGIFHAVGKVVWNKREDPRVSDPEAEPPPKPPDHLSFFDRQKVSQVNTDELFNETGTDIPTFLAALHENYVLSANGSHFPDVASECIDFLSDSDLLSPGSGHMSGSSRSKHGRRGTAMQAGGMEMLRQNEISFQVGVKGLLFSLPSPVNRAPHPNGKKGDSFKMFYPASLKMWKPREEIHDLISLQMSHFLSPSLSDGLDFTGTSTRTEGVESWKSRSFFFQPAVDDNEVHDDDSPPRIWTTRDEALLDRLPYLARINNKSSRDIKRITQFNGSVLLSSGDDEEADGDNSAADVAVDLSAADETTDRVAPPSPQKSTNITSHSAPTAIFTAIPSFDPAKEVRMEKLYISEDDIEDG